jgi:hypothetical protein
MKIILFLLICLIFASCSSNKADSDDANTNERTEYTDQFIINSQKVITWYTREEWVENLNDGWVDNFNRLIMNRGADFVVSFKPIEFPRGSAGLFHAALESHINSGTQVDIVFVGGHHNERMVDPILYMHERDLLLQWNDLFGTPIGSQVYNLFDERYWRSTSADGIVYGLNAHYNRTDAPGMFVLDTEALTFNTDFIMQHLYENPLMLVEDFMRFSMFGYPIFMPDTTRIIGQILGYQMLSDHIALDPSRGAFHIFEDEAFLKYITAAGFLYNNALLAPDMERERTRPLVTILHNEFDEIDDMIYVPIMPMRYQTAFSLTGISATSEFAEECMFLFYLLLTDGEVADALAYGRHGTDYRIDTYGNVRTSEELQEQVLFAVEAGFYRNCTPSTSEYIPYHQRGELDFLDSRAEACPTLGFRLKSNTLVQLISGLDQTFSKPRYNFIDMELPMWSPEVLRVVDEKRRVQRLDEILDEVNRQWRVWRFLNN